jgi:peptidoglycan L-alanyl-D-glutamate endopeptidase CwlK
MTHYSTRSLTRLHTCHGELQKLLLEVDKHWPNTILEGKRTIEQQRENVAKKVSKTMDSRHLDDPSNAVDAAPDPLSWPKMHEQLAELLGHLSAQGRREMKEHILDYAKQLARWYYFAGFVLGTAQQMGIDIRWGGDWDGDRDIHENTFDDLPHYERRLA